MNKLKIKNFIASRFPVIAGILQKIIFLCKKQLSKIFVKHFLRGKKNLLVEVGAGDKKGENGWITVDITNNCDIFWDLRDGMPFSENSVSKIYSSHFMEHLSFKEGQQFLKECLSVLAPGGEVSICVPNAKLYLDAYAKQDFPNKNIFFGYKDAYNNTTRIDYVNYVAYMDGNHKYMFDEDNLIRILEKAGFKDAMLRNFDAELDLERRDYESIYAKAIK